MNFARYLVSLLRKKTHTGWLIALNKSRQFHFKSLQNKMFEFRHFDYVQRHHMHTEHILLFHYLLIHVRINPHSLFKASSRISHKQVTSVSAY